MGLGVPQLNGPRILIVKLVLIVEYLVLAKLIVKVVSQHFPLLSIPEILNSEVLEIIGEIHCLRFYVGTIDTILPSAEYA